MATSDDDFRTLLSDARRMFEQMEADFLAEVRDALPDCRPGREELVSRLREIVTLIPDPLPALLQLIACMSTLLGAAEVPGRSLAATASVQEGIRPETLDAMFALWLVLVTPAHKATTPTQLLESWTEKVWEWQKSTTTPQ